MLLYDPHVTTIGATWSAARSARAARPARVSLLMGIVAWCARVSPSWPKVRTTVMQLAAFAFLDYAAWRWSVIAGCVAIGVSLFILEALSGDAPKRGNR